LEKIIKLAINIKKTFILIIFIFFFYNSQSKSVTNNVIVTIDNSIITELDLKKEIEFIKFINKSEIEDNLERIRRNTIENLIDRKIKQIEIDNAKIEITEKEIENYTYNYLVNYKINDEILKTFYKAKQIENNYLKNLIIVEIGWEKLIRKIYVNRVNVNLTEINEEIKKTSKNSEDREKIKNQIISLEINKVLNKYSTSHLEKSKKKYLIKFL
jgi:3-phenylpropionate/cinnamic acid dioxygenase small subunit